MKNAFRTWIFVDGVSGFGIWRVTVKEYESLWARASWGVRLQNDSVRARKEWAEFYNGSS